jgi:tripartite-type tricarboxylate transporter receptor subunit TctC
MEERVSKTQLAAACALALTASALPCTTAHGAETRAYPTKPVRLVLPFPPGGGVDAVARIMVPKLSETLGQPVIVDNRGGAGGNIAAEIVAKSPPDGYVLLLGFSTVMTVNKSLSSNAAFDPVRDFEPITQLATSQYVLAVHPSIPARSVAELVRLAKAKPGALNYATGGVGSPLHLAAELFKNRAGVNLVHIPYKGGGPAASAVLTGEAHVIFGSVASSIGHINAGKLRALAVTGLTRSSLAPELPTIHESGYPNFNVTGWHSYVAPAGTPREIVNRIHAAAVEVLRAPEVVKALGKTGYEVTGTTPEQLAQIIRSESETWAKVVKAANIRGE